jgi:hypothetical protein
VSAPARGWRGIRRPGAAARARLVAPRLPQPRALCCSAAGGAFEPPPVRRPAGERGVGGSKCGATAVNTMLYKVWRRGGGAPGRRAVPTGRLRSSTSPSPWSAMLQRAHQRPGPRRRRPPAAALQPSRVPSRTAGPSDSRALSARPAAQNADGTTQLLTSNVGDARILLIRGGKAIQLSEDHVPDRWAPRLWWGLGAEGLEGAPGRAGALAACKWRELPGSCSTRPASHKCTGPSAPHATSTSTRPPARPRHAARHALQGGGAQPH